MTDRAKTTMPGSVEKIIKPIIPTQPEKAQISVEGADDLYREIRIDNTLLDEKGHKVKLKEGAKVEVTIEAPAGAVTQAQPIGSAKKTS